MKDLFSNIVDQKNLRNVQAMTLQKIADTVANTAGPYGSNTIILGDPLQGKSDIYTKDGHKTLLHIDFFNPLEKSIQSQLVEITEYIVKTVGDGTTSTVLMCNSVFKAITEYIENHPEVPTFEIVRSLDSCIEGLKKRIKKHGRDVTTDDIYDICMISTNGNTEVSRQIADIYEQFGTNVYINVGTSNTPENILKSYDGLTLERGFGSPCYINTEDGRCVIRNPRIYTFTDPVDTPEMISYMEQIIYKNIVEPLYGKQPEAMKPTVIMAPSISRDANATLTELEKIMYACNNPAAKPPILIIAGLNKEIDQYEDLVMLCGGKSIKKYINPDIQEKEIAEGKAPSKDNIIEWYGTCDEVTSDNTGTKFINPKDMFDISEDGTRTYSATYDGLINFIRTQLEYAIKNSEGIGTIGNLRRRLNSLQSNMVDYLIGGISMIDRDATKDLVDDAVLNCRSACKHGVGYGSNFEGYRACKEYFEDGKDDTDINRDMMGIIWDSYEATIFNLYNLNYKGDAKELMKQNLIHESPINLRTLTWGDEEVLCSIDTDIAILDAIKKMIIPMATANQALLLNPQHNKYLE